jgi:DNA invertase Pin-like site-specific DNA recombinase
MKGTMSEMELSVFRQRSIEAMKQKARRGELFLTVAVGYVKAGGDRIEKDADRRVQQAITLVFRKFAELQTIRQVWCGAGRRRFCCPPWQKARPPSGSYGACPSIRPSITC